MDVLLLILPSTLIFAGLLVFFLIWGLRSGQYDDVEGEKYRILFDDEP